MSTIPKLTMMGLYNYNDQLFDKMNLPAEIVKDDFINVFLLNYGEYPVIYPNWGTMQFALGVWSKKWYHSIERIITAMTEEYNPLYNFDRHEEYEDIENKSETVAQNYGSTITANDTGNKAGQDILTHNTTDTLTHNTTDTLTLNTEEELSYNSVFTETDTRQIDTDGTNTDEVSAYNSSDYQPDKKATVDNTELHSGSLETERTGADTTARTGTETTAKTGTETSAKTGTDRNDITENHTNTVTTDKTGTDTNEMTGDRGLQHTGHLYGNIGVTQSTDMLKNELLLRANQNILDIVSEMLFKEVCIYTY